MIDNNRFTFLPILELKVNSKTFQQVGPHVDC